MDREKKKFGKCRRAFNYAGAVFLGIYFTGPQISASQSNEIDDIARRTGLTVQEINTLTKPRTYYLYPEKESSTRFAQMTFLPKVMETVAEQQKAAETSSSYDFYGFSYRDTVFGPGGYLDRGTRGMAGKASPCYVFFPSEKLALDDIKEALSNVPAKHLQPLPGTLQDYLRLILFHETEHCHQVIGTEAGQNETDADRRSFDVFLEKGGDPEIVRTVLNLRMVSSLTMLVYFGNDKTLSPPHSAIAGLYGRYFGGPRLGPEDHETAMTETLDLILSNAHRYGFDKLDILYYKNLHEVARHILNDPAVTIPPRAEIVLNRYVEAYESTVIPMAPRKLPPAPIPTL
ncbi:MAG: hypothetical protein ACXW4B_06495 [Micavibrio sp.]